MAKRRLPQAAFAIALRVTERPYLNVRLIIIVFQLSCSLYSLYRTILRVLGLVSKFPNLSLVLYISAYAPII